MRKFSCFVSDFTLIFTGEANSGDPDLGWSILICLQSSPFSVTVSQWCDSFLQAPGSFVSLDRATVGFHPRCHQHLKKLAWEYIPRWTQLMMSGSPSSQVLILSLAHFPRGKRVVILRQSMPMSLLSLDFKHEPSLLPAAALRTPHLALINLSQLLSLLSLNNVISYCHCTSCSATLLTSAHLFKLLSWLTSVSA